MVPGRGLEPPRRYQRQHLKLVRLPIPPSGHVGIAAKCQTPGRRVPLVGATQLSTALQSARHIYAGRLGKTMSLDAGFTLWQQYGHCSQSIPSMRQEQRADELPADVISSQKRPVQNRQLVCAVAQ